MPDETTAPEESGQATETEAPETGQAEAQESFTDFDPSQIPEEARPHVEALQKQWQANYTKTRQAETQAIAQERQEAQELREFAAAMQDPATRDQILQEQWGYQFEDEGAGEEEFLDPEDELRARLENVEGALTQQQTEEVQAQQTAQATDEIAEGIEALEKSFGSGFEFDKETLKAISSYAEVHGPEAIPEVGKVFRGFVDKWIANKGNSPRRISQGMPASKVSEPKDRDERLALAVQAMEDHEASA